MKRISVIWHFGFGLNLLNGQTIKTKIITEELERIFGNESVKRYDTPEEEYVMAAEDIE